MIIQMIGILAAMTSSVSFIMNKARNILLAQMLCSILLIIHYYYLDAITAMAFSIIMFLRFLLFFEVEKSKLVLLILLPVNILVGLLTYESWLSLLVIMGTIGHTVGFWKNESSSIRKLGFPSTICWLIYDFAIGSIGATLMDCLTLSSITIGYYKYDKNENSNKVFYLGRHRHRYP